MFRLFPKKSVSQSEFTAGTAVSVWIGDFHDEDVFDDYLRDGFTADFGFIIDDRNPPEISSEPESKDIRTLLTGFSLYDQFIEGAVRRSDDMNIRSARAAAVFHFLAYDESYIRNQKKMKFLGTFAVEGFK